MTQNPIQKALLAVLLFTVLFILLVIAAAYLWTHDSERFAMVCFIAAFISMLCQIGSVLLFVRHKQMRMLSQQGKKTDVQ